MSGPGVDPVHQSPTVLRLTPTFSAIALSSCSPTIAAAARITALRS
jgi:hypothetical protein